MTEAAEFGLDVGGLIGSLRDPDNAPGYTEARILAVLKENGVDVATLSDQELSVVIAGLYADNVLFESGDALSAKRQVRGIAHQVSDDEPPAEAGKVQAPEPEPDNSRLGEAVAVAFMGAGITFMGDADPNDLHPECTDGFEPEKTKHAPLTSAFMELMRKRKPS